MLNNQFLFCIWLVLKERKYHERFDDPKKHQGQFGEVPEIEKVIGNISNGFFIEVGALNGISISNTLYFELARNWSGNCHVQYVHENQNILVSYLEPFEIKVCVLSEAIKKWSFLALYVKSLRDFSCFYASVRCWPWGAKGPVLIIFVTKVMECWGLLWILPTAIVLLCHLRF